MIRCANNTNHAMGSIRMSDESEQAVLVERRDRVMVITLNRPEAMNAINGALSNGLLNAVRELDADDGLTAGVITGAGRGFCSGMDLKAFARGEDIGPLTTFIQEGSSKPLIAAIEGFALAGGCEIALTCDLLVVKPQWFACPVEARTDLDEAESGPPPASGNETPVWIP